MVPEQFRTISGDPIPEPARGTEDPASPPERLRLADDDLRRILERATRLDAERVTGVTVEDLRQIAAETGISPEALALALREAAEGELPAAPAPKRTVEPRAESTTPLGKILRRLPGWIRTTGIAWGSTVTGFFASLSASELPNGEVVLVASFVVMVWGAIELSVFHRKRGSLLAYERDLLALWLPFSTVGALIGAGGADEEFFLVGALFWAILAVLGGLIATVRKRKAESSERGG